MISIMLYSCVGTARWEYGCTFREIHRVSTLKFPMKFHVTALRPTRYHPRTPRPLRAHGGVSNVFQCLLRQFEAASHRGGGAARRASCLRLTCGSKGREHLSRLPHGRLLGRTRQPTP